MREKILQAEKDFNNEITLVADLKQLEILELNF
jgi:hypothetical protein